MAFVFISDGGPDAEEYDSNYIYFDESNPEVVSQIEIFLRERKDKSSGFSQLEEICRKSYIVNKKYNTGQVGRR